MRYVCIENDRSIPIEAIKMLGVTDKGTGSYIGQFGTGMKYAIAAALCTKQWRYVEPKNKQRKE